ncbi:type II toxin-antitoxin system mRNA interferase toxin, RelE/StbE family [candidate division KSB1 bacterium]|nr:type II toxin-antitoxin system mRNA interferase toxin, RelE/StbE family [candidate division KSB1 bacterium]
MAYKITFKNSVQRDLKQIDKADARLVLEKIESELAEKADQFPPLKGKYKGLRKFRTGQYRVIFTLLQDTVLILRISHRKDAYR